MIIESDREEIGCICYACFHLFNQMAELDIWLKKMKYCGNCLGPEALRKVIIYLKDSLGIKKFIIRPSEKNKRAIRAYEKVGFVYQKKKTETIKKYIREEFHELFGDGDYGLKGTAILTMEV